MTREDLHGLVDNATPETLPDLIRDLEAAKARALERVATWARTPRKAEAEPVTGPEAPEILKDLGTVRVRVRRGGYSPRLGPDADAAVDNGPSAKGMFSCMVAVGAMLMLYLVTWLILTRRS